MNVKKMFFLKLIGCAFTMLMVHVVAFSLGEDSSSSFAKEEIIWLVACTIGIGIYGIILPCMLITSLQSLQIYFTKAFFSPFGNLGIYFQYLFNALFRSNQVGNYVLDI